MKIKYFICSRCNVENDITFSDKTDKADVCFSCGHEVYKSLSAALHFDYQNVLPVKLENIICDIISQNRPEENFFTLFEYSHRLEKDQTCYLRYCWFCYILLNEVSDVWFLADNKEPYIFLEQLSLFLGQKSSGSSLIKYQHLIQPSSNGNVIDNCDSVALNAFAEAIQNTAYFVESKNLNYIKEFFYNIWNVADERLPGKDSEALYYWTLTVGLKNAYLTQPASRIEHKSWCL